MPGALKQLVSVYLLLVGLAVAVQFIIFPFYEDHDTDLIRLESAGLAHGRRASLLAVARSLPPQARVRRFRGRRRALARVRRGERPLLWTALALTLAFFPAWFWVEWGTPTRSAPAGSSWHMIDTALPILFVVHGLRSWRESNA